MSEERIVSSRQAGKSLYFFLTGWWLVTFCGWGYEPGTGFYLREAADR